MRIFLSTLCVVCFLILGCDSIAQNGTSMMVDLNVTEFENKLHEENVVILDVRTPAETAQGIIKGAIEIDIKADSFKNEIEKLDKDKTYLVYCRSGRRSVAACKAMEKAGFKKLYNLEGGYLAWTK